MLVAVIGAGACGLTAIKACKEVGLRVVCFEQSDDIGGLWKYKTKLEAGSNSVTKTTIINTSKETTSFSDFPPPIEYPNFMHNSLLMKYIRMYAEKFELISHVKFNHRVEKVVKAENYNITGNWKITITNMKSKVEYVEIVSAVMVCSGHHTIPTIPSFPGQEKYKGKIIHTCNFRSHHEFEGKKVVVVGTGNSAVDAAVDLSSIASRVYLSTRRGCWIIKKVSESGKPYTDHLITRFNNIFFNFFPFALSNWYMEKKSNQAANLEFFQLKPNHGFFQQHPTMDDVLPIKILSGAVSVKGNIECFKENGIVFEGEAQVTETDYVVLATGYQIKFPFLSKEILDTTDNRVELYKLVFPQNLDHPTLSFIGLIQALGGAFPIFEMQCRWVAQVLNKEVDFPSPDKMKRDVASQLEKLNKRYYNSMRHTIQVDYINYLDEIASIIGVKPNLAKIFFSDVKLFRALLFGPSLPYQYRLQGPHPWSEARETILLYPHRLNFPLQKKNMNNNEN